MGIATSAEAPPLRPTRAGLRSRTILTSPAYTRHGRPSLVGPRGAALCPW